jgi:hypothetical protein
MMIADIDDLLNEEKENEDVGRERLGGKDGQGTVRDILDAQDVNELQSLLRKLSSAQVRTI